MDRYNVGIDNCLRDYPGGWVLVVMVQTLWVGLCDPAWQ